MGAKRAQCPGPRILSFEWYRDSENFMTFFCSTLKYSWKSWNPKYSTIWRRKHKTMASITWNGEQGRLVLMTLVLVIGDSGAGDWWLRYCDWWLQCCDWWLRYCDWWLQCCDWWLRCWWLVTPLWLLTLVVWLMTPVLWLMTPVLWLMTPVLVIDDSSAGDWWLRCWWWVQNRPCF